MESLSERWVPVVGREQQFEVSTLGRVRSLPHTVRHWSGSVVARGGAILAQSKHSCGYRVVSLRDGCKHYVHRLVMAAFAPRHDAAAMDVNHVNGDKTDNRLENLEWATRLDNVRHAIAIGLQNNSGSHNGMSKYTPDEIQAACKLVEFGCTIADAAKRSGVSRDVIESVLHGRRWQRLGLAKRARA